MRRFTILIPIALVFVAAEPAGKDAERIQGTWEFVSAERSGKDEAISRENPLEMSFQAETFRFHLPAGANRLQSYKLHPEKSPKEIDWLLGGKQGIEKPILGIYELDGNSLKICWGRQDGERPKEFDTKRGGGDWLWVMKRQKSD